MNPSNQPATSYFWLYASLFLLAWLLSFYQIFSLDNSGILLWLACMLLFHRWYQKSPVLHRFAYGVCAFAILPLIVSFMATLSKAYQHKQVPSTYQWVSLSAMLIAIIYTMYFITKGYKRVYKEEKA